MVVFSEDLCIQQVNHVFDRVVSGIDPIGRYCYEIFRGKDTRCQDCPAQRSLDLDEIVKDLCIYKVKDNFDISILSPPL